MVHKNELDALLDKHLPVAEIVVPRVPTSVAGIGGMVAVTAPSGGGQEATALNHSKRVSPHSTSAAAGAAEGAGSFPFSD